MKNIFYRMMKESDPTGYADLIKYFQIAMENESDPNKKEFLRKMIVEIQNV